MCGIGAHTLKPAARSPDATKVATDRRATTTGEWFNGQRDDDLVRFEYRDGELAAILPKRVERDTTPSTHRDA